MKYLFIYFYNPVDALHPFPSSSDGVWGGDGGWGNPVISLTGIWPNIDPAVDPASPGGRSTAISLDICSPVEYNPTPYG